MNRVSQFLARQLGRASDLMVGDDRVDYRGHSYKAVFDSTQDQKELEPGFYSHTGARLQLLIPASEFETKPVFTLKAMVSFRGQDWKVDEMRQGDVATTLGLVDPKSRES